MNPYDLEYFFNQFIFAKIKENPNFFIHANEKRNKVIPLVEYYFRGHKIAAFWIDENKNFKFEKYIIESPST